MTFTLLVTGATGFVGQALLTALQRTPYLLRAAVRHYPQRPIPSVQYHVVGELDAETDWSTALTGVNVIIHLAARVHVMRETEKDPLQAFRRVNVEGTARLLQQAVTAGVQRFIYISTIKVNGETTQDHPFSETDLANPQDPYAQSKWEAEQLIKQLAEPMAWVIIRPPLIYGARAGGNFARLVQGIKRGLPWPLAAIHNQRSLLYIDNLVDFLIQCVTHPAAARQLFLLADTTTLSTPELIRHLAAALKRPARLFYIPIPLLQALANILSGQETWERLSGSLRMDTSKAQQLLTWRPPIDTVTGLQMSVEEEND